MAEETAQTKLREAYDKARESLEKKTTELDKAFDKEQEARVDVIRDLDKEKDIDYDFLVDNALVIFVPKTSKFLFAKT